MKNILILLTALLLTSVGVMAQTVPEGMRFQAIARGLDGSLLTGKQLTIKVELLSTDADEKIFFTETHQIRSNEIGLLDFVIGEGADAYGSMSEIPWSTEEMWVRISVKEIDEEKFQIISSGQLFSVPYALYAQETGKIAGGGTDSENRGPVTDQTSIFWTVEGNFNSHNRYGGQAVLGTTDKTDVTIITSDTPRMIIDKFGNIVFFLNVDINGDLNVDGSVNINGLNVTNMSPTHLTGTLTVDESATLNDSLTVMNMAPTHLTGTLDVDRTLNADGASTLNNTLAVTGNNPTTLTGTLSVDKATTLNDDLTVTNAASSNLTGTLDVDKTMTIDGATTLNSNLGVIGGQATTLSGTLEVGKSSALNGLKVDNMAATRLTGSLDVDNTLNADGATTINQVLSVTGSTVFTGNLTVGKITTINDDLTVANMAPTHLTGSLDVDGAISVDGEITVDGPLNVIDMNPTLLTGTLEVEKRAIMNGGIAVKGIGAVGPGNEHLAFFENQSGGSADGIGIKIDESEISKENNYMTFYRGNGSTIAGRIEGYEFNDIADIPVPTGDEIWSAVCIAIADYNPLTILWTQFAGAFNLMSSGWNGITYPSWDVPDIPAFAIPDVPALSIPDVPAFVIPDVPGFEIPSVPGFTIPDIPVIEFGPYLCGTVCFCDCCDFCFDFNCCCVTECVIPYILIYGGLTIPDFPGIGIPDFPGIPIPDFPGIPIPDFPGIAIPDFPGLVIPAVPEVNLGDLFGQAPTIPTFSDILVDLGVCPEEDLFDLNDGYFSRLVSWAMEHRVQSLVTIDPIMLVANGLAWGLTTAVLDGGIVYGSKGADYAEYLPKVYPTEKFLQGDLVGVYNGKISKNTEGADQVLAITSQPLVLGNMQPDNDHAAFEKVAFLGQIPVYVRGPVSVGDYIVASGKNDGIGVAINPESMTTEVLSHVLGQAWSDSNADGITLINTSIGLRPNEITAILKKQSDTESLIARQIETQRESSAVLSHDLELMKTRLGLVPLNASNP